MSLVVWTVLDKTRSFALRVGWRWGGDVWIPVECARFDITGVTEAAVCYIDEDYAARAARDSGGVVAPVHVGAPPGSGGKER